VFEECANLFKDFSVNTELYKSTLVSLRRLLEGCKEEDPMRFWQDTANNGLCHVESVAPHIINLLRPLAAMFLAFPAGEAKCERDFSFTGSIITKTRTCLSDSNLEDSLIVKSWTMSGTYSKEHLFKQIEEVLLETNT
jgi:hypothetical protein